MKIKNRWSINEVSRQVHEITYHGCTAKDEFWALLMSDEHWDSADCARTLLTNHHREALERGAPILKFGDTFDVMQGKWDKRADQNALRPEHRGNNYFDRILTTAEEYYSPFSQNIALITPGNHEQSVLDRHQTNLTEKLVHSLRGHSKTVHLGGYWGFVRFKFLHGNTWATKTLCYHHGYGGGGEVTRGFIDNNRTRSQYNADLFYSGHVHRRNVDENIITELSGKTIVRRQQLFLRGSTYKDETEGWHASKGRSARPLGGWWLKMRLISANNGKSREVQIQELRAA